MLVPVVRKLGRPDSERITFLNVDMPQQLPAKGDFLILQLNEQETTSAIVSHYVRKYDHKGDLVDIILVVES